MCAAKMCKINKGKFKKYNLVRDHYLRASSNKPLFYVQLNKAKNLSVQNCIKGDTRYNLSRPEKKNEVQRTQTSPGVPGQTVHRTQTTPQVQGVSSQEAAHEGRPQTAERRSQIQEDNAQIPRPVTNAQTNTEPPPKKVQGTNTQVTLPVASKPGTNTNAKKLPETADTDGVDPDELEARADYNQQKVEQLEKELDALLDDALQAAHVQNKELEVRDEEIRTQAQQIQNLKRAVNRSEIPTSRSPDTPQGHLQQLRNWLNGPTNNDSVVELMDTQPPNQSVMEQSAMETQPPEPVDERTIPFSKIKEKFQNLVDRGLAKDVTQPIESSRMEESNVGNLNDTAVTADMETAVIPSRQLNSTSSEPAITLTDTPIEYRPQYDNSRIQELSTTSEPIITHTDTPIEYRPSPGHSRIEELNDTAMTTDMETAVVPAPRTQSLNDTAMTTDMETAVVPAPRTQTLNDTGMTADMETALVPRPNTVLVTARTEAGNVLVPVQVDRTLIPSSNLTSTPRQPMTHIPRLRALAYGNDSTLNLGSELAALDNDETFVELPKRSSPKKKSTLDYSLRDQTLPDLNLSEIVRPENLSLEQEVMLKNYNDSTITDPVQAREWKDVTRVSQDRTGVGNILVPKKKSTLDYSLRDQTLPDLNLSGIVRPENLSLEQEVMLKNYNDSTITDPVQAREWKDVTRVSQQDQTLTSDNDTTDLDETVIPANKSVPSLIKLIQERINKLSDDERKMYNLLDPNLKMMYANRLNKFGKRASVSSPINPKTRKRGMSDSFFEAQKRPREDSEEEGSPSRLETQLDSIRKFSKRKTTE